MKKIYWQVCLEEILPQHGIQPSEQLINDIYNIAEMESEACGYYNIPNKIYIRDNK